MPEWMVPTTISDGPIEPAMLLLRLLVAMTYGFGVAAVYRFSHGREQGSAATLTTTLVLLAVLIAMVSMTIGNSVARAFSLVGALSIVRFRTVVDDTRDTAFVIFSVIVGMAAGCGLLLLPAIGLPVVGAVAFGMSRWRSPLSATRPIPCRLQIRLALGRDPEATLGPGLAQYFDDVGLVDVSTARQGAALDLKYVGQLRPSTSMASLVNELNRIEGVMSVELTRTDM